MLYHPRKISKRRQQKGLQEQFNIVAQKHQKEHIPQRPFDVPTNKTLNP
jgi:hypothetical protein